MDGVYEFVKRSISRSKEFKNVNIESILDFPTIYCVSYTLDKAPIDDFYVDCFLSVDKKTGFVKEYNPIMDMQSFKKASKNPVYTTK